MSHTTTTVVTKQVTSSGGGQTVVTTGNREWHSGIGACADDGKSCALGFFCPLCYACLVSQRIGEHGCAPCFAGIHPLRLKTRLMLGIKGTVCKDCCASTFCGPCVLCQMGRELDAAGWPK